MKTSILAMCLCLLSFGFNRTIQAQDQSSALVSSPAGSGSREQDRLSGQVRRVRVESAKVLVKEGKTVEAPRVVREITTYGPNGEKIDSVAYPVQDGTLPGKKEYQYDDRANILEMIVRGEDGSLLSREKYDYEFDEFGNWKKMTSFVALYENGNIGYEPIEITYRTITYYYGQVAAKVATVPAGPSVSNMILAPIAVTRAEKARTREPAIASVVMPKVATSEEKKGGKSEVPQLPVNVSSKERVYTPALGSAERQAIIGALRASVARELRKPMIFRVGDFKVKNGWAELSVTPLQHNLQPFDYQGTPYEKCMAAGNCKNYVTAVLRKQGVVWTVVKYVIGSKDVPAMTDARPPNAEKPGTKEPQ